MLLALSICVLLISLTQEANEAQFLNTTSLASLSAAFGAATRWINRVPLTTIYASL